MLQEAKENLLTDWCRRVIRDPSVPAANRLSTPHLRDHMPDLIDRIIERLMCGGDAQNTEQVGRRLGCGYESQKHAHDRFSQGYTVAAATRELSLLRVVITDYCVAHDAALAGRYAHLINMPIDEAMSAVATEIAGREQREKARALEILERGIPVLVLDSNWKVVFANAGQELVSQTSRDQTRGVSVWEIFPALKSKELQFEARYREAMTKKIAVQFEEFYPPLEIWTEQNVYPTRDGGIAIFFNDISRRKRDAHNRQLLNELSGLLAQSLDYHTTLHTFARLLVQYIADYCMIDLVDDEGRFHRIEIAAADPRKLELMRAAEDYPPSSAPGSPFQQVLTSRKPMLVKRVTPQWLDELADHSTYRRILGELAPTSVMLVPLVVRDRSIGVIKLLSTASGHGYDERDLEVASDLGQRAAFAIDNARLHGQVRIDAENLTREAELRERFIGVLSHDIRTPLSAVLLTTSTMLTDESLPERFVRGAQRVVRSAERMDRMVRDLLDLTRVRHAGGITISRERLELGSLVREVVDEVQVSHSDRQIEIEAGGNCNGLWDRDRIAQVVNNLVVNALNYSPPDSKVAIRLVGNGGVELIVHNQGAPIPPRVLPTLFAPYKRTGLPSTPNGGLGLGLYIAFEIVRAHNGTMSVDSAADRGTTFTVKLPRQ